MDPAEQAERSFQRWAALAALAIAVAATVFAAATLSLVPAPQAYLFLAINLVFLFALAFVPGWLHARPGFLVRGILWQAVLRWVGLAVAAAYWLMFFRPDGATAAAACLGGLAVVNTVAAGLGGRHWRHHDLAWTLYFAGDFVVLVYLVATLSWPLLFAVIAASSAFLLILGAGHGPRAAVAFVGGLYIGLLYGGTGWMRSYAIAWFTVLAMATYGVARLAAPAPPPAAAPAIQDPVPSMAESGTATSLPEEPPPPQA